MKQHVSMRCEMQFLVPTFTTTGKAYLQNGKKNEIARNQNRFPNISNQINAVYCS